ncbi:MAG: glycosyltransferase family A protein [Pseudomonadota bacterium]
MLLSAEECRKKPTAIFIISYNRGEYLKRVISSYKKQDRPVDIIIHDNGSDDLNTRKALADAEKKGIKVYYKEKIHCADELNNVSETIHDYFRDWSEPQEYIVTDCDIDLSMTDKNAINIYSALLNKFNNVDCVGPMLTIADIPHTYPLRNKALNRHIMQFWHKKPLKLEYDGREIFYIFAPIDTTFAIYRAGSEYRRLKSGLRLYNPFEAKHLDWHEVQKNDSYSQSSNSKISHWSNEQFKKENKNEKLHYSSFYIIQQNAVKKVKLQPGASFWRIMHRYFTGAASLFYITFRRYFARTVKPFFNLRKI